MAVYIIIYTIYSINDIKIITHDYKIVPKNIEKNPFSKNFTKGILVYNFINYEIYR